MMGIKKDRTVWSQLYDFSGTPCEEILRKEIDRYIHKCSIYYIFLFKQIGVRISIFFELFMMTMKMMMLIPYTGYNTWSRRKRNFEERFLIFLWFLWLQFYATHEY